MINFPFRKMPYCFSQISTSWRVVALLLVFSFVFVTIAAAQKKPKPRPASASQVDELTKLREEFVKATNEYKASLSKLLVIYEGNVTQAEEKLEVSRKLFSDGLIARTQVEANESAVAVEKQKVAEVRRQMEGADSQIANVLVETAADEQIARSLRNAKGRLLRTTSFIRYTGSGSWSLSEAWKIQRFFSDKLGKQLPIAVFGQGAIHDQWHLDHRNAMDISLHPDGADGRALLEFLQQNGIPYSAFRSAIPGTATGPHIHIGRPSHRY